MPQIPRYAGSRRLERSRPTICGEARGRRRRHLKHSGAFEAISATPFGSVEYERERSAEGGYFVWLDRATVNRLERLRGPGERYSDVILRLAAEAGPRTSGTLF